MSAWDEYELNDFVPHWALREMSRREARAEFRRAMGLKDHRLEQLRRLLKRSGVDLDFSDRSVTELNAWFIDAMEPLDDIVLPDDRSLSICEDVALFLGDLIIDRIPDLRWEFYTWGGKSGDSFQNHVIYGFPGPASLHLSRNLPGMISGYGVWVVQDRVGMEEVLDLGPDNLFTGVAVESPPLDREYFTRVIRGAYDSFHRDLNL